MHEGTKLDLCIKAYVLIESVNSEFLHYAYLYRNFSLTHIIRIIFDLVIYLFLNLSLHILQGFMFIEKVALAQRNSTTTPRSL